MPAREFPYNALPDPARQALLDSVRGAAGPTPVLASVPTLGVTVAGWGSLSAACFAALAWFSLRDLGSPTSGLGWRGLLVVLPCTLGGAWAAWAALLRLRAARRSPLPAGVWLFPLDLVDTTGPLVRVIPLRELTALRTQHRTRNGFYTHTVFTVVFPGRSYAFRVAPRPRAEACQAQLDEVRRAAAAPPDDPAQLAALDAFGGFRGSAEYDRLGPGSAAAPAGSAPLATPLPAWWWRPAPWLLPGAAALAVALTAARDLANDELAWRSLSAAPSSRAAEAYLAHCTLHAAEVRADLLPRARIREAVEGRRLAELRRLKAELSPQTFGPELAAAIHELYAGARAAYTAAAHPDDPDAARFLGALLAWGEAHDDPRVEVRYVAPSTEMLEDIDTALAKTGAEVGTLTLVPVAPHFAPAQVEAREAAVSHKLADGFGKLFSAEMLDLHHVGRIERAALEAPIAHPVIDIRYFLAPSGQLFSVDGESRAFVGVVIEFIVTMRVPDSDAALTFTLGVEPPTTFEVVDTSYRDDAANDRNVYDTMATRAYERVGDKLYATFFGLAPSPVPAAEVAEEPEKDTGTPH